MHRKTLSRYIIWPHNIIIFSQENSATHFGIKAQFIIRKGEAMVLACRASYDKKSLAQQVIPLAPGYRTALLSRPAAVMPNMKCKC